MESPIQKDKGWLTEERKLWIAGALLCVVAGFGLGNGHTTQNAVHALAQSLYDATHPAPQTKAQQTDK